MTDQSVDGFDGFELKMPSDKRDYEDITCSCRTQWLRKWQCLNLPNPFCNFKDFLSNSSHFRKNINIVMKMKSCSKYKVPNQPINLFTNTNLNSRHFSISLFSYWHKFHTKFLQSCLQSLSEKSLSRENNFLAKICSPFWLFMTTFN